MPLAEHDPLTRIRLNLIEANSTIIKRVQRAVRHYVGDQRLLRRTLEEVGQFSSDLEPHLQLFSREQILQFRDNINFGYEILTKELQRSTPRSSGEPVQLKRLEGTGRRGRPKVMVDPVQLSRLYPHRGFTSLAPVYQCNRRTLRRRALELGLVQPGPPVFSQEINDQGEEVTVHRSVTRPVSTMTDEQLDNAVRAVQSQFDEFGRSNMKAALANRGHIVPDQRVADSLRRVNGVSGIFGNRRPERRKYVNPGPMFCVHHDGQHGLIRWKIVVHCFIDGFSRYILGIRAHNNNRAQTVLNLFLSDVVGRHPVPEKVRGDHGVENVMVAAWMREVHGAEERPYLWGASRDNTRSERLWVDFTRSVGQKWFRFFWSLEDNKLLVITNQIHLWLLHTIFLPFINYDIACWVGIWNTHNMSIEGEHRRSPTDMFVFGIIQGGIRARPVARVEATDAVNPDPDVVEYDEPGEVMEGMEDSGGANGAEPTNDEPGGRQAENLFNAPDVPQTLSRVDCEPPPCPFSAPQIHTLMNFLGPRLAQNLLEMPLKFRLWKDTIEFCGALGYI